MLSEALEVGEITCLIAGVSVTEALRDTHTQIHMGRKGKLDFCQLHNTKDCIYLKESSVHLVSTHNEVLIKIYKYT